MRWRRNKRCGLRHMSRAVERRAEFSTRFAVLPGLNMMQIVIERASFPTGCGRDQQNTDPKGPKYPNIKYIWSLYWNCRHDLVYILQTRVLAHLG